MQRVKKHTWDTNTKDIKW